MQDHVGAGACGMQDLPTCCKKRGIVAQPSFFITTPIYYVNAKPHLGTAYSTVLTDVQARYRRLSGYNVFFLTGMDEHGQKVAEAAADHGLSPQEWVDSQVPAFKELWNTLEISEDDFIRTTQARQKRAVQYLWERMQESGYLYKGSYDGWYCVPEETYFTQTQVDKADEEHGCKGQHLCPDCGRPLERVEEESYFFKLSAFQDKLLALYDEHPDFVMPSFRMNEVRTFVESGLQDLSVSRTSFDWGIKVPFDDKHVTYVWFDALLNYMTAVGYGQEGADAAAELSYRWPAQYHIVGKDIIRFHCVIWPAMLMAIKEAVPQHVFAHGFLMVKNEQTGQGEKMSKSRGNAIAPQEVIDLLGVDGYRYYFMTDVVPGEDGAISFSRMEQVYNADLANSWGNLVSRALNMSSKYFEGKTPVVDKTWVTLQNPLREVADGLFERYAAAMDTLNYVAAKDAVMELVHAANHYVEDSAPWTVAKDPARADELAQIVANLLESIRIAALLLAPFMPSTSNEVLRRMGCAPVNSAVSYDFGKDGDAHGGGDDAAIRTEDATLDNASVQEDKNPLKELCVWGQYVQGAPVEKGEALFPRLQD